MKPAVYMAVIMVRSIIGTGFCMANTPWPASRFAPPGTWQALPIPIYWFQTKALPANSPEANLPLLTYYSENMLVLAKKSSQLGW